MPENIRNAPSRRRSGAIRRRARPRRPARTPADRARPSAPCCSETPARSRASTREDASTTSPSVDRPNRLTIAVAAARRRARTSPRRRATRNATTMSRIVAVGEPGVRLGRLEQAGEHRGRDAPAPTPSESAARRHDREDRAGEDREQPPRLHASALRAAGSRPQRDRQRRGAARRRCLRATMRVRAAPSGVVVTRPRPCSRHARPGSSTSSICCSVRMCFSRTSSMMPRPVFSASAASSVALS